MNNINMDTIRLLIDEELYKSSSADKDTICDAVDYLMDGIEIDDKWSEKLQSQDMTLEMYIVDGIIKFMSERGYTADNLCNHEDYCEILNCIHEYN